MIFSPEAIANKTRYLDSIDAFPKLVESVVADFVCEPFELRKLPRFWEPGGGATCFRIILVDRSYFLKVKHRSVFVESRLETEHDFIYRPSLENEVSFLATLGSEEAPEVLFYEEREELCFLALEWLVPFAEAVSRLTVGQLSRAWEQLELFARGLFARGIVHTDIHEGNVCFRGEQPIVCDFEEARYLRQECGFEESLDYCGSNRYGNVGEFPAETGKGIAGLTCLFRLRKVFGDLIRQKLREYLQECRFDHECPFNLDALQEEDPRIYQSIEVAGLRIAGQRPLRDIRKNILRYYLFKEWQRRGRGIRHIDLGSNLGTFCFLAARYPFVVESVGLEAFDRYVEAAQALRFLSGFPSVRFQRFVCGEESLSEVGADEVSVCTMLSVYHHIADRERFLADLARNRPALLLAEFATQERYFPERGSLAAEIGYARIRLGYRYSEVLLYSPDYHRPLVLFADERPTWLDRLFMRLGPTRLFAPCFAVLMCYGKIKVLLRSATGSETR